MKFTTCRSAGVAIFGIFALAIFIAPTGNMRCKLASRIGRPK